MLGGVSVYEAQSHWITRRLDKLAENVSPEDPHSVEFHASATWARRSSPWKGLTSDDAKGTIMSVLNVLAEAYDSARAFACVVHKPSFPNRDPMEVAFEDLCSRFDRYLGRLRASGDDQRGLVILDNSALRDHAPADVCRVPHTRHTVGCDQALGGHAALRGFSGISGYPASRPCCLRSVSALPRGGYQLL